MAEKIPVLITLKGCDDSTQIKTEVTFEQYGLLHNIAEWSLTASEMRCQPTFNVQVIDDVKENNGND